jgi:hypothetical protein
VKPWAPPSASDVVDMWQKADQYLVKERRDYWMNASYYASHQWIWWDFTRNIVQELDYANEAERGSRITIDKYGPRCRSLLARLTRSELIWEVQPTGMDDSSMRRQRLQEQLLMGEQRHNDWEDVREMSLLQTLFGGASAIAVDWDPDKGEDYMIDPISQISVPMGGIRLTPLGINEFTLEPGSQNAIDARWWIRCTSLPPEQVQERYNLEEVPKADAEAMLSSRHRSILLRRPGGAPPRTTLVYVYYERPTSRGPGCVVHVVNGKVVLQEDEWPFPFKHLNMSLFRQNKIPNTWVGHTLLTPARDVQYAYNRARSTILEHMRKAANARLMIPSGSVDDADSITIDPADTLEYNSEIGEPHWQTAPEVPRWISGEAQQLEMELDDIFHTHQTTRGEAPGDRNSGLALALLAEKDDTPLGPMAKDQSMGWGKIAEMTLSLYKMNAESTGITRNTMLISENGVPLQVSWNAKDIDDKPVVLVPMDATMPRSKIATQSMITNLAQQFPMVFQNVDPKSLSKMLDLPDPRQFLVQMDPDIAKAEWENGLLMQGIPVVPEDFDVHDAHIMEHNRERKSPAYELADPQVKQIIDMHIMAHMQFLGNETAAVMAQSDQAVMGEMQDPGITAALNAGVGLPLPEDGMMQEQEMMDEQSMGMAGGLPPEAMSMMGGQEGSIPMMGMEESMGEEMLPGMEGM